MEASGHAMEANQSPRQAEASDSDAIAALHVKSWRATYRGILPDTYLDNEAEEERRNYWQHHLSRPHPDDLVMLFQDGDHLLGFISIIPAPDHDVDALIENLHVDPETHGRGLGRRLIAEAVERLLSRDVRSICLWVYDQNEKATAFYSRLGGTIDLRGTEEFAGATVQHSRIVFRDLAELRSRCTAGRKEAPGR